MVILGTFDAVTFRAFTHNPEANVNYCSSGQWCAVDVASLVGPSASGIALSTLLLITNGKTSGISNLMMGVRKHGTTGGRYHAQTLALYAQGGSRASDYVTVELSTDKKYDVWWDYEPHNTPDWPEGAAYGINQRINVVFDH